MSVPPSDRVLDACAASPSMSSSRRVLMMAGGWGLIIITPFVAIVPGPGGIFTFAGGVGLLLRSSQWARRSYVKGKRRWPQAGRVLDRALMRASARRRADRLATRAADDGPACGNTAACDD